MTLTRSIPAGAGAALRWLAVGIAAGLLIASAGAFAPGPRSTLVADPGASAPEHTLGVSGIGRVTLTPDTADIRLGVNIIRPTAKEARDDAAVAMNGVVEAIRKAGIPDRDIQTSMLSLQPVYDYSTGGNGKLTGFQVVNAVAVVSHDLNGIGDLVDAAVASGATTIEGISFRVQNQTAAEAQARQAAVADAKAKADALASAAGVTIVGVASISETSGPVPGPVFYAGAAPAKDMATPVQPGTTDVTVTVSIVYVID